MVPPVIRPGDSNPMIDRAVTLLPEPLSPTSPRISPRSTDNEASSTAVILPSVVSKLTCRFSIESSGSISDHLNPCLLSWVEHVTQPVAEQIEAEDGEHDRRPRRVDDPPRLPHVLSSTGEHRPPLGGRWLGT